MIRISIGSIVAGKKKALALPVLFDALEHLNFSIQVLFKLSPSLLVVAAVSRPIVSVPTPLTMAVI
jgi:hypothetical protein